MPGRWFSSYQLHLWFEDPEMTGLGLLLSFFVKAFSLSQLISKYEGLDL